MKLELDVLFFSCLSFQIKQSWKYVDEIYSHNNKEFGVSETFFTKYDGLFKSFLASKNFSGNWPLKGPALRSADKYTTLLPLAWPIKPEFDWRIFLYKVTFRWILVG